MKNLILIIFLFTSNSAFSQKLSEDMKDGFKNDDPTVILTEMKTQELTLNDCFEIEGSTYSLLAISIRMDRPKIFAELIANKSNLNKLCSDQSPLMFAAKYGKLQMAKALVKAGADISLLNKQGETALAYAKKYDKKDIESYLSSIKTTK